MEGLDHVVDNLIRRRGDVNTLFEAPEREATNATLHEWTLQDGRRGRICCDPNTLRLCNREKERRRMRLVAMINGCRRHQLNAFLIIRVDRNSRNGRKWGQ